MIWYLLYPFRGTVNAPVLDPKHPLRNLLTRYGIHATRHPVITLLISVAIAAGLIYPFPFLYTNNCTNGASNLPHHVWTSAQPFEGSQMTRPDVVMRSVWVHGSYMKALDKDVLQTALEIQDTLLGPTINFNPRRPNNSVNLDHPLAPLTTDMRDTFHAINGLSNSSWFFHSPLQYWNCSEDAILEDQDIITTVNQGSTRSTSVNVTLRHSIVFSGKRFEDQKLVAADALVITLVHMLDSPVGRHWERKAEELALTNSGKWRLFPSDVNSLSKTLYEFRFQPLSLSDDILLCFAYLFYAVWFSWTLLWAPRLEAVKSRIGLMITLFAQAAMSVMSSFTICAVFKVDLSQIPGWWYPLVFFMAGIENNIRFVKALIETPSQSPTRIRIGEALGLTGHIALAGVFQNLAILWGLAKVVSPPIQALCAFSAIAIFIDCFFTFTFFTAVFSVDVRRMELHDTLFSMSGKGGQDLVPGNMKRQTWMDALQNGDAPFVTRIAGTIVMIGFILMAQWHFFADETYMQTMARLYQMLRLQSQPAKPSAAALLSVDIHQARTPTAWLRMQDHETAHEVIQVIKPKATSYIARVYDPLIFVLDGADRTPNQMGVRPLLPAAYDFVKHRLGNHFIFVVVIVAAVSLFMNYLLWDEYIEVEEPKEEPLLSVRTLKGGHSLDIMLLAAEKLGVIATVGLDRWIRIWDVGHGGIMSYIVQDPETLNIDPFPVVAVAIDQDANWLAILSGKNCVYLWNIPERRWGPTMEVEVKGRKPVAFCFGRDDSEFIDPIIIVRHNGVMSELKVEANEIKQLQICRSPLVCVRQHLEKPNASSPNPPARIITSSKKGCVHIASQIGTEWISDGLEIPYSLDDKEILSILPLPALSSFLAVRSHTVDLVDVQTHNVTHTFNTQAMKAESLRCFHSTRRRPQCGSVGLSSLALAYTTAETGKVILHSYLPRREGDTICFRDPYTPGSKTCCLWRETVENRFEVENPGQWEALHAGYLVGIRKRITETKPVPKANTGVRRRGSAAQSPKVVESDESLFEVWALSSRGETFAMPLYGEYERSDLLFPTVGPIQKMSKQSIVVPIGNIVKIITIGNDRFEAAEGGMDDEAFVGMVTASATRRKKGAHKKTK